MGQPVTPLRDVKPWLSLSRSWQTTTGILLICLGGLAGTAFLSPAQDPGAPAGAAAETEESAAEASGAETESGGLDEAIGILFVSKASSPKVYAPVQGAKTTVLAPARVEKYGVRLFSKEAWSDKGLAWNDLYSAAVKRADGIVAGLKPDFRRDSRGVIDYALVEDENPWLTSALLSSRFLPRFEKEFGERLHVIVIDRNRLFVFPADGGELASYAPALADLYHDETVIRPPVSLEIFLVDKEGFRVVGEIEN